MPQSGPDLVLEIGLLWSDTGVDGMTAFLPFYLSAGDFGISFGGHAGLKDEVGDEAVDGGCVVVADGAEGEKVLRWVSCLSMVS